MHSSTYKALASVASLQELYNINALYGSIYELCGGEGIFPRNLMGEIGLHMTRLMIGKSRLHHK